jgi:hypothetical protein
MKAIQNARSHGIGPSLAHAVRLLSLQAMCGAATGHAVGDTVRVLVDNNVIFKGAITVRLFEGKEKW